MRSVILQCSVVLLCTTIAVQARWVQISDEYEQKRHHDDFFDNLEDKYVVQNHKIVKNHHGSQVRDDGPPDHTKYAQMARFIVHTAEWVSMGTISTLPQVAGYPFVNILSTADGPRGKGPGRSTGVPYFYTTKLDFSAQDLSKDNRLTVMISLAQEGYCREHDLDAEDPRCARIMLSGKLLRVRNDTKEYEFAYNSLAERHPIMKTWPKDHNFFLAKLKIANIAVLDWFGGPHYVPLEEYFKTDPYGADTERDDLTNDVFDDGMMNEIEYDDGDDADRRRYVSMVN